MAAKDEEIQGLRTEAEKVGPLQQRCDAFGDAIEELKEQLDAALALYRGDWERLINNENGAKAHYAEADKLAAFQNVPRAPEFLPRASFETDPEVLASATKAQENNVIQPWTTRFPGVSRRVFDALASTGGQL